MRSFYNRVMLNLRITLYEEFQHHQREFYITCFHKEVEDAGLSVIRVLLLLPRMQYSLKFQDQQQIA